MIQVTTTLSYGLRLLSNLAHKGAKPTQLKRVASEEAISLAYLRKLVIVLERAGIVRSTRGPGGGFVLSRSPSEIELLEVINALSRNKIISCIEGAKDCGHHRQCLIKALLSDAYSQFQLVFKDKTLASIVRRG